MGCARKFKVSFLPPYLVLWKKWCDKIWQIWTNDTSKCWKLRRRRSHLIKKIGLGQKLKVSFLPPYLVVVVVVL